MIDSFSLIKMGQELVPPLNIESDGELPIEENGDEESDPTEEFPSSSQAIPPKRKRQAAKNGGKRRRDSGGSAPKKQPDPSSGSRPQRDRKQRVIEHYEPS